VLTALLGLLIGADVLFGAIGLERWRAPFGVPLVLVAAILGGARIVYGALEALLAGRVGADVALAQACIAALVIGQPFVAAEVVFIALVGEVLEAVTADRALAAIRRLFDQTPRIARVRRDGQEIEIPAYQVAVGDLVLVRPGERVPVDGTVVAGRSSVDQAALTGESLPIDKGEGDAVYNGTVNQFGLLEVRAEKIGTETTLGQVLRLVADAQRRKAPLQKTADRLARLFLPVVQTVALLTIVAGYLLHWPDVWLRAVAILVVACPCGLILATPAAVMASMAWLARHGVVIKGGVALERLAHCDTFAFDKTGTLTLGRPELAAVVPLGGLEESRLLALAAAAEHSSGHTLAAAITRAAAERKLGVIEAGDVQALPGAGVRAHCEREGRAVEVLVGNRRLLGEQGVALDEKTEAALAEIDGRGETPLLVAVDGAVAGLIGVRDEVRREAHDVIHDLKHLKISEIAILTGDREAAARRVGKKVHVKNVAAELLPADKARWIEERQAAGRRVAMVGDGINDAPALARADVGIALGGVGADLAAEAGDLVLLGDPLKVLPDLVKLSRATVAVIRQNILIFAFGLNAVAMASAALGILGPVPAAILHQVGSLLVLLNAMRLLAFGDWRNLGPIRWVRSVGDAIHRLDDRLDPGFVFDRMLARWRTGIAVVLIGGFLYYLMSNWISIGPDEVGLLRRQGRYVRQLGPGLHLRWPPPVEEVTRMRPDRVRSVAVGFRAIEPAEGQVSWESAHDRWGIARSEDEALLLTGDGRLVELTATAQYRLDPGPDALRRYAFGAAEPDAALRPLAESAVREVVGRRRLDELLTARRHAAEVDVADLLRDRVATYGLGLRVVRVDFQDVHPPLGVVDAYRDVTRAENERQRQLNDAATYRAERLADARGLAATTLREAEADRDGRVARAAGLADSFRALVAARSTSPPITDLRLYLDTLASALADRPKLLLDPSSGRAPRLILPDSPSAAPSALKASIAAERPSK
jgi:Cu+-exporting ATPase